MGHSPPASATIQALDDATRQLVRVAAALAAGSESEVRQELQRASDLTPPPWIEELILQTYLFAGFPRALNGMREWRRLHDRPQTEPAPAPSDVRADGEHTCRRVYGGMYEKLRVNIRALHPVLDDWMITEGYGKVLSRPALDLARRELCIVAACAASGQERQLHSHLHGARNVGVPAPVVDAALASLSDLIPASAHTRALHLWHRVRHDVH